MGLIITVVGKVTGKACTTVACQYFDRRFNAAEFAALLVERGRTDAVLTAEFGDRAADLCLLKSGDDLAVGKT